MTELIVGLAIAVVVVPLAILALALLWPLLLGCALGHPIIGLVGEVIWLGAMR